MPPAPPKTNWLAIVGCVAPVLTFFGGLVWSRASLDTATDIKIQQNTTAIAEIRASVKPDHDLLVKMAAQLDDMVKRAEKIERKLDAQ